VPRKPSSIAKPATEPAELTAITETAWIPLDPETDRGAYGLTPLILHRLGHRVGDSAITYAQKLAHTLLERALEGNFSALEEILVRIDGDAKSSNPPTRTRNTSIQVDDLTARRILDALREL
jgi:hypothetical protein